MRLETREHAHFRQHFHRGRRAWGLGKFGAADQLFINALFFRNAQAIGHFDHKDAVNKGFVVLVVFEGLPFRLVGVRHNDARKRDRPDVFGAHIIAFLRRGEQGVQHLDWRFEHFNELKHALVGAVKAAGIGIRIGIILGVHFQLADIDLAHQR